MEFIIFYIIALCTGLVLGFTAGAGFQDLRWKQYKKNARKKISDLGSAKSLMNSRLHDQKNQYESNRSKLKKNIASHANEIDRDLRGIFRILNNM